MKFHGIIVTIILFFKNKAQDKLFGKSITFGLPEPDIEGITKVFLGNILSVATF